MLSKAPYTLSMTSNLPKPGTALCSLDDLSDPAARGFYFGEGARTYGIIVVRQGDEVFGYLNVCPHQLTPLEMFPDKFFTRDGRHLLCTTHGARFEPETGFCVSGPCKGASLKVFVVVLEDGQVVAGQNIARE